jgi:hypothetical protein
MLSTPPSRVASFSSRRVGGAMRKTVHLSDSFLATRVSSQSKRLRIGQSRVDRKIVDPTF